MPRGKRELAERIIPKLREAEVELGRGKTVLGKRPGVAGTGWCEDVVHRAGVTMGERLCRDLQRQAPGRATRAGSVRRAARGQSAHRAVAAALQQDRPHSVLGYQPQVPGAWQPCVIVTATPPQPDRAGLMDRKNLTWKTASFMGAGQSKRSSSASRNLTD